MSQREHGRQLPESATYTADGALKSATLGATAFNQTWLYNARGQMKQTLATNTGGTKLLGLTYAYTAAPLEDATLTDQGIANNGNIHQQRIEIGSASRKNIFIYDGANRIATFADGAKEQGFGYDAYGNLRQTSENGLLTQLRAESESFFDATDNRVTDLALDAAACVGRVRIG